MKVALVEDGVVVSVIKKNLGAHKGVAWIEDSGHDMQISRTL